MTYKEHLEMLRALPPAERDRRIQKLLGTLPARLKRCWPHAMPASIDPKLVLVGVSPGNSPAPDDDGGPTTQYISEPTVDKPRDGPRISHIYYPDSRKYTAKLRYFSRQFFLREGTITDEHEALSLLSVFNLGMGSSGQAHKGLVEKDIAEWVSSLLNGQHKPDLVVFLGLINILKDDEIADWLNRGGLSVDWQRRVECSTKFKKYRYREWTVKNAYGHPVRMVIWPNHPSKPPFTSMARWEESVQEYLERVTPTAPV